MTFISLEDQTYNFSPFISVVFNSCEHYNRWGSNMSFNVRHKKVNYFWYGFKVKLLLYRL